jgi:hypothetical protein
MKKQFNKKPSFNSNSSDKKTWTKKPLTEEELRKKSEQREEAKEKIDIFFGFERYEGMEPKIGYLLNYRTVPYIILFIFRARW